MLEIELWKPCLDCPSAAIATRTDEIVYRAYNTEATVVYCEHAEVCRHIDGAEPLIGGES